MRRARSARRVVVNVVVGVNVNDDVCSQEVAEKLRCGNLLWAEGADRIIV